MDPSPQTTPPAPRFGSGLAIAVAFLLPLVFVGTILGVASHEILGHGLTAELLGGTFHWFVLMPDGMGRASTSLPPSARDTDQVYVLLGGVVASVALGVLLLVVAGLMRGTFFRLALTLLAVCCLADGGSYTFWSALYPGTRGDASRALELLPSRTLEMSLIAGGVLLTVLGAWYSFRRLFHDVSPLIGDGRSWTWQRRLAVVLALFALPYAALHYAFDWNQLIEGIGGLPAHASLGLAALLTGLFVIRYPAPPAASSGRKRWPLAVASAWACGAVVVYVVLTWTSKGVTIAN